MADIDIAGIGEAAYKAVKAALQNYIEREEVLGYAKAVAELYAKEYAAVLSATTEDERNEHMANLGHLRAQVRGEVRRLQLAISEDAVNTATRVIEAAGGLLLELARRRLGV